MRHKRLKLTTVLLLGLGLTGLQAQNAVPASGGNASGSGGSVSYTVGQIVYTTHTGTNGSASQGVQQPYEISIVSGLEEAKEINLMVSAYPNPTTDYLTLEVKSFNLSTLTIQLLDLNGKLLKTQKIEGTQTSIEMNNLVPATYFLRLIEGNKEVKSFKVVKR